jgi:aspartate aminotransferase
MTSSQQNPSKLSDRTLNIAESSTTKLMGEVQQRKAAGEKIISFNAGEPDFDPPELILEATREALFNGKTKYGPVPGEVALRKAIAQKLKRDNGMDVTHEHILVANGSKQILYMIFQGLCNPGDEVIVLAPYWVTFPEGIKLAGGIPVFVDTIDHQPDLAAIEAAITPRTKAILVNSPNNPTGAVYPKETLQAIGELAVAHEIYVISDEAYEGLVFHGAKHISMASLSPDIARWTITTQTFSKSYCMTGFRVGYLAADLGVVKALNKMNSHLTGNVCTFAQYGAVGALEADPAVFADMQKVFEKRLDLAYPLCQELFSCVKPAGAFYLFPDISDYLGERFADDNAFAAYLLSEAKVAVVPGSAFGAPGHLRVSFSTSEAEIEQGFAQIKAALK